MPFRSRLRQRGQQAATPSRMTAADGCRAPGEGPQQDYIDSAPRGEWASYGRMPQAQAPAVDPPVYGYLDQLHAPRPREPKLTGNAAAALPTRAAHLLRRTPDSTAKDRGPIDSSKIPADATRGLIQPHTLLPALGLSRVEQQLLAWGAEPAMPPSDEPLGDSVAAEMQGYDPTWATLVKASQPVPMRREPVAAVALCDDAALDRSRKRPRRGLTPPKPSKGSHSVQQKGSSKARRQLKALEQINLMCAKVGKPQEQQTDKPGSPSRTSPPAAPKAGQTLSGPRIHQLAQERTVERLIDQVHTLGLKKASLRAREAATQQAIQAIHDACFECSRPGNQAYCTPHADFTLAAASCGLDAQAVVEGILRHKCRGPMRVTRGPLCCIDSPADLLHAPEEAYLETEASYLSALGTALAPAGNSPASPAGRHAAALEEAGLMPGQTRELLTGEAGLTAGQTRELLAVRENYMNRTRRILQQRQALWHMVRANLLDTSLEHGCPSAESKICAFEKVLELRRNMDDFHWNFAWMAREWMLRILTPFQVAIILGRSMAISSDPCKGLASAGMLMLETLAAQSNQDPGPDMLHALSIPSPADCSRPHTHRAF
ncbi:hypothetical protein WJX84_001906 [Apatococcus fuscideae]|uniref:Uncharacterized protein n=1 Tax=Apatococcus fuscideae TaxID=2026836 RepID=A0AAW1TG61_9CHLO